MSKAMVSGTALVWVIGMMVSVAVVTAAVVTVLAPEQAGMYVAAVLAALTSTIAVVANLVKTNDVAQDVQAVRQQADELVNGLGDAKTRAAVADVLADDLIDPNALIQLREDRAKVAAADRARLVAAHQDETAGS